MSLFLIIWIGTLSLLSENFGLISGIGISLGVVHKPIQLTAGLVTFLACLGALCVPFRESGLRPVSFTAIFLRITMHGDWVCHHVALFQDNMIMMTTLYK